MKKNGQYVGVDERFVPEEEKYVNDSLMSNEEAKATAKKGFNIVKKVGIGYLIFIGVFFLLVIGTMIFMVVSFNKTTEEMDKEFTETSEERDKEFKEKSEEMLDDYDKTAHNGQFTIYQGTQSKFFAENLLDKVITNNNTSQKVVAVVYNNKTMTTSAEIISLKQSLDDTKKYEVQFDYDAQGYINKATITAI